MCLKLPIYYLSDCLSKLALSNQNIENKTKGMKKFSGNFNFYWDDASGKILFISGQAKA